MKKFTKGIFVVAVVFFMGVGLGTTTYALSQWIGSSTVVEINEKLDLLENYDKNNLKKIEAKMEKIKELEKENSDLERELEEQNKLVDQLYQVINEHDKSNAESSAEIIRLTEIIKDLEARQDVSQALRDVEAINRRLDNLLSDKKD